MITIQTYMDDGRVYEYAVEGADKAREHAGAIVRSGYRHAGSGFLEWYPPHRILKVKIVGVSLEAGPGYQDRARGTG